MRMYIDRLAPTTPTLFHLRLRLPRRQLVDGVGRKGLVQRRRERGHAGHGHLPWAGKPTCNGNGTPSLTVRLVDLVPSLSRTLLVFRVPLCLYTVYIYISIGNIQGFSDSESIKLYLGYPYHCSACTCGLLDLQRAGTYSQLLILAFPDQQVDLSQEFGQLP